MFLSKENRNEFDRQLSSIEMQLKTIENELFVENHFYFFPGSKGTKKLPRREALPFTKLCSNYCDTDCISTFYTNEADYKVFEALIEQWKEEAKKWKKEALSWGKINIKMKEE